MLANAFIPRTRLLSSSIWAEDTKSFLFKRSTSAKAICSWASLLSQWCQMLRIHDRHDRVQHGLVPHIFINKKGLDHRSRICQTGRLNDEVVKSFAPLDQISDDANQITSDGAADAPVIHFDNLLLSVDHELSVDTDLTEFVYDYSNSFAVL